MYNPYNLGSYSSVYILVNSYAFAFLLNLFEIQFIYKQKSLKLCEVETLQDDGNILGL